MMNQPETEATGHVWIAGTGRVTLEREIARLLALETWQGALYLGASSYGTELLEFLVGRMSDEDDARDVLSMTLDDALNGISSFAGRGTFRTWLYVLAKNARARFVRDPSRHRGHRSTEMSSLADSTILQAPRLATFDLDRIRRDLDEEDQELLSLYFDRQLSWGEIAVIWSVGREPLEAVALCMRCQRLIRTLAEPRVSTDEAPITERVRRL